MMQLVVGQVVTIPYLSKTDNVNLTILRLSSVQSPIKYRQLNVDSFLDVNVCNVIIFYLCAVGNADTCLLFVNMCLFTMNGWMFPLHTLRTPFLYRSAPAPCYPSSRKHYQSSGPLEEVEEEQSNKLQLFDVSGPSILESPPAITDVMKPLPQPDKRLSDYGGKAAVRKRGHEKLRGIKSQSSIQTSL